MENIKQGAIVVIVCMVLGALVYGAASMIMSQVDKQVCSSASREEYKDLHCEEVRS